MNAPYHSRDFRPVPSNIEAEQALLGAILLNNAAYSAVADMIGADDFWEPFHRKIFETVGELIRSGKKASPVTIKAYLPEDVQGLTLDGQPAAPMMYLARLITDAVTVSGAPDYALSVLAAATRRSLVSVGESIAQIGYQARPDQNGSDLVAQALELVFGLSVNDQQDSIVTVHAQVDRMMSGSRVQARPTISLPLPQLSEVMGADLEAGNLYGMLSGSGEGKTSMVLQIIRHAAEQGHPVLLLSYDQLWDQCLLQMVSQKLGIEHARLKDDTRLQTKELDRKWEGVMDLRKLPMAFKKCSGRRDGSAQIAAYAKRFLIGFASQFEKAPLIVLDHVRKVKPKSDRDHEGRVAAEINGVCKDIASEHDAVWLSLNQRSSAGAKRKNPRPIDADIYGGEMAREDYDGMFYLYRAWKYRKTQLATAADEREEKEVEARFARGRWEEDHAELGALKVRWGDPSVRRRIRFEAEFTRYVSMRGETDPALFEGF